MFCYKCGKEINDNSSFCQFCGVAIEIPQIKETEKVEEEIKKEPIEEYISKFPLILESLDRISKLRAEENAILNRYDENKADNKYIAKGVAGVMAAFIGFLLAVGIGYLSGFKHFFITIVITITVAVILAVKSADKLIEKMASKKDDKKREEIGAVRQNIKKEVMMATPLLQKYIPPDYWYAYAIEKMYGYFKNGRADSMKESINLYEDEMCKEKMISLQEDILRENQKQSYYSYIIAVNTSI